jgi:hypothetical protein
LNFTSFITAASSRTGQLFPLIYDLTINPFRALIPHNGGRRNNVKGGTCVADYKKLYYKMFNAATDAEKLISQAACIMRTAQQECEETYMNADETPLRLTDKPEE